MLLSATSGTNSTQRGHGRNTALSISIPVGSVLAIIIIVFVILVLCIVRTIKRNKNKK